MGSLDERAERDRHLAQIGALVLVVAALMAPLWRCGNSRATLPLASPVPPAAVAASAVPSPLSAWASEDVNPQEDRRYEEPRQELPPRPGDRLAARRGPRVAPLPSSTLAPALAALLPPAAAPLFALAAMLPDEGFGHSRLGMALGTFPGTTAADLQIMRGYLADWHPDFPRTELSLDAMVNHQMAGLQIAAGSSVYIGVGGYRGFDGTQGLCVLAGVRF